MLVPWFLKDSRGRLEVRPKRGHAATQAGPCVQGVGSIRAMMQGNKAGTQRTRHREARLVTSYETMVACAMGGHATCVCRRPR